MGPKHDHRHPGEAGDREENQGMKYCAACQEMFEPTASKIAKYCSVDCAYDHGSIQTIECATCGDTFDPKFTKTFNTCGCEENRA